VIIASFCFVVVGCSRKESVRQEISKDAAPSASAVASLVGGSSVVGGTVASAVHDPAHPPIDCPLKKQGIDVSHMRPFKETAKYIEFLERPDRAEWQKPDAVVAALGLGASDVVFDLGAGSGYFSFRFAAAVPAGKVIAADTEAEMIRHVHHRSMTEAVQNVQVKLIEPNAPEVDAHADVVFICDVLHHVTDRPGWLRSIAAPMKSGARLALIEFKEGQLPEGPPESAKIPRAELVSLVTGAGLNFEKEHVDLLPYQVFLEFRKP
jgi:SAM-dependent methyltransferase